MPRARCSTLAALLSACLWLLSSAAHLAGQDVSVQSQDGAAIVTLDGRPLLEYRYEPHPTKLYVARWYTPGGVQILRDSPHDHVHHHALMYAIGIDKVDFWSEVPPEQYGRQVSDQVATATAMDGQGRGEATIEQSVRWEASDHQVLALETRKITAHIGLVPNASLLTWQTALRPSDGKESIELWGRHYFGLGMRMVETMDQGSEFLLPQGAEGEIVRGTERLTNARWCAVQGTADGKPITVAMFDAPTNPRHPAAWFTMTDPFAYMGATLRLHEQPLTIARDKPLQVRYGIAVWDGLIGADRIEQAWQQWVALK